MNEVYFLLPNWKWLAIILAIFLGIALQLIFKIVLLFLKKNISSKEIHLFINSLLKQQIETPLSWILVCLLWMSAIEALELPKGFNKHLLLLNQIVLAFYLIRLSYLASEAFGVWLTSFSNQSKGALDAQLANLATKSLKVFVVIFGFLVVLQNMGLNVLSLLAGLGLGGLALALAAQDTAANVFGSITIILDKPFQIGDYIKVTDTEGMVEEIGFRSTRIRTFYNSLVTIPNSVMAKEKIDNMGVRPSRRIRHIMGITYDTPTDKIETFMDQIKYLLGQHPHVQKDDIRVFFQNMGDFNLQILVQFYVVTEDLHFEYRLQEEILLNILNIAKQLQVEFAFPTQTIHMPKM